MEEPTPRRRRRGTGHDTAQPLPDWAVIKPAPQAAAPAPELPKPEPPKPAPPKPEPPKPAPPRPVRPQPVPRRIEQPAQDDGGFRYGSVRRWRHEYKYRIDARQQAILQVRAQGLMQPDPHVQENGAYIIRSLYLDDLNDTCLRENLAGTDPRSKFRIRYYNGDTDRILLEKKTKQRGMCLKDSCSLTRAECEAFIRGETLPVTCDQPEMKRQLLTELRLRDLRPRVIVTYERVPFICQAGNVRVTFDRSITSSEAVEDFLTAAYPERPVLPTGECVLEVKWDEVLPRHLREGLRLEHLRWTAFSKYFMCRMHHL